MSKTRRIERGDLYCVDPNPVAGREMRDRHSFVVATPVEINALGLAMMVPVTSLSAIARAKRLRVSIQSGAINGVAVCNQLRTFDLSARVKTGAAGSLHCPSLSHA